MSRTDFITPMEKTTGFLMYRTARAMKKMLDAALSENNVTSSQTTVLNALYYKDGQSLSEIGKKVHLDKPAITGLADRMENDGLVLRKRTSSDRRKILLYLTNKGKKIFTEIEKTVITIDRELVNDLTKVEIQTLQSTLEKIWQPVNGKEN